MKSVSTKLNFVYFFWYLCYLLSLYLFFMRGRK